MAGHGGFERRRGGHRWRIAGWGAAAALLLAPLVAMQFTGEVKWTPFDFAVFGAMLAVAGGALELVVRVTRRQAVRAVAGTAIAVAFLLAWAHGAVGLF
ncbi:MAG TPA: hypothetical protein PLE38_07145 [Usitatibacteraceae bacterium]|jgi:peptidoglycan/LPS O-acetylase OafA/YrhL|nr:hypothetical protein [Usitatibacteraceae bacterium]